MSSATRRRTRLRVVRLLVPVLFPVMLTAWLGRAAAAVREDGATISRLSILTAGGVTPDGGPGKASYPFGECSLLDRTSVRHDFTLRNTERHPVTVVRVKATCGCTSAALSKSAPGADREVTLPLTLAPGEEMGLRLTVDLTPLPPGRIKKSVSVFVEGQAEPAAIPAVSGTLLPSVTFDPPIADLGRVDVAAGRSLLLTATFEPRLLAAVPRPVLSSSTPSVRVTELASEGAAAGEAGTVRRYRLELAPDAPLGPLTGVLGLRSDREPGAQASPSGAFAAALRSARVALTGQVVGDMAAEPQVLAFGVVERGREATRSLTLTAKRPEDLDGARVDSQNRWLSGFWSGPANGSARLLTVTLADDAPPGALSSRLIITSPSGTRLQVPFTAYVRQPQAVGGE